MWLWAAFTAGNKQTGGNVRAGSAPAGERRTLAMSCAMPALSSSAPRSSSTITRS